MTARLYEITVRGRLTPRFGGALNGFAMVAVGVETGFRGWVVDDADLLLALSQLSDLGLELTSVRCLNTAEGPAEAGENAAADEEPPRRG